MNATFRLDRGAGILSDAKGRRFDAARRVWVADEAHAAGRDRQDEAESVDAIAAATWLQRESGRPLRVPIGVVGPREATVAQCAAAEEVGALLAGCGFAVICGGRQGVMQAACEGAARNGGLSIGVLPDADPALANPFVGIAIATGIGEARNALIARAAFCLVAIGDSFGTLSEVALGRQFGKLVIGLQGAAQVDGVHHVASPHAAVSMVAELALGLTR
ncbi:MAG TPA: hypothetical protein VGK37_01450 [Casimicrobiaceae bacterium]|jgi:hypothetical protein